MIKIFIAEKLLEKRKAKGITQEQLAEALAITPQSISKWERREGYPDITMLPAIADYFDTSVDDLLGTDSIKKEADLESYRREYSALIHSPDKRLALVEKYHKKYPGNTEIMLHLVYLLVNEANKTQEECRRIENLCNRILSDTSDPKQKQEALFTLCMVAEEPNANKYLAKCPSSYALQKDEIWEARLMRKASDDKYSMVHAENTLRILTYLLTKEVPNEPLEAYHEYRWRRSFIEFLGIPEAWLGFYALLTLKCSAALFALNRYEQGKQDFMEAMNLYRQWFAIQDGTPLPIGNDNFLSGIATRKNAFLCYHTSAPENEFTIYSDIFLGNEKGLHLILTRPIGWEQFDTFREDECYKQTLQWLEQVLNK